MDLKVLTWNIQNYGPTKQKYSDIVKAIATTVVNEQADIFVLLEINTTSPSKAKNLAETMQKALKKASGGQFKICVLSPNTGREFYAFFYRDENVTVPYTTSISGNSITTPKDLSTVQFKSGRDRSIQRFGAPLVRPDIAGYTGRHTREWPGTCYPSFALFRFNKRFVGIFACHYAASSLATSQVRALPYFSVLAGVAPPAPPVRPGMPVSPVRAPLNVKADGKAVPVQCVIVTGDFNIDYKTKKNFYASLEASRRASGQLMQIGAEVYNDSDNTLLVTPRYFKPRAMKDTKALAQSNIDNHFVATSRSAGFAATNYGYDVPDIPGAIRGRSIVLNESVTHYAELDQKGFKEGDYQEALKNFANQLAGDKSNYVNRQGALIGARLISDHLPVVMEVDIN